MKKFDVEGAFAGNLHISGIKANSEKEAKEKFINILDNNGLSISCIEDIDFADISCVNIEQITFVSKQ